MRVWTSLVLLLLGLIACSSPLGLPGQAGREVPSHLRYGDKFPVIKPFDLTRAGAKVTADFELPNALDPNMPETRHLRPVFVGFRFIIPRGGYPDVPLETAIKHEERIESDAMRFRVRLWRLENGQRIPVVLHIIHRDLSVRPGRIWYEPHPGDIFSRPSGAGTDNGELEQAGHFFEEGKVYGPYQLARIIPPTPGRYHLEVESLADHPMLAYMPFELVVSHYHVWGI